MTSLVFYFQVHQPYRVRPYAYDEIGRDHRFFDDGLNEFVAKRVAEKCYLPMNDVLAQAIDRSDGAFQCTFSVSGTALRQLEAWAPEAIDSFRRLAETGSVEFLCETSRHSLAALADPEEFRAQVDEQRALLDRLLGVTPTSFRNTELIVDASVARQVKELGFDVLLGEGAQQLLGDRSARALYGMRDAGGFPLLLRDFDFSDDIAFRFSNQGWEAYPLFAPTFVEWLEALPDGDPFVGLFMDYETFGEHQSKDTGIFSFMGELIDLALASDQLDFATPRQIVRREPVVQDLVYPRPISWADAERDLSAWLGNQMQRSAHEAIYSLGPAARASGDAALLNEWRDLTTSDHVYYMSTKFHSDGDVHEYFSPYDSPHDAFLYVMNAVEDLRQRLDAR